MNELQNCTPYVAHLRAEHRRLHADLLQIERNWAAALTATGDQRPQIVAALEQLRGELVRHFDEEDEGGCLEEAVSRCPSLGPEADRIEREHPELLAELNAILADLADLRGKQPAPSLDELHARFKQLVVKLHAHEAAENRLLEQAFGEQVE